MPGNIVVTGGASGIGEAVARRYAQLGHPAVLFDSDKASLERVRDEMTSGGHSVQAVHGDVTSTDDLERLADTMRGPVDIVFANAGIAVGGVFDAVPYEEWERLFDVNVFGVVRTINAFMPLLREQQAGHLVIMSSSAGLFPDDPFHTPYASSKAALIALGRSLRLQVQRDRIDVSVACPRLTATSFAANAITWTRRGRMKPEVGQWRDADTVDLVVDRVVDGLAAKRFLISTTPGTADRMIDFAKDPDTYLARLGWPTAE